MKKTHIWRQSNLTQNPVIKMGDLSDLYWRIYIVVVAEFLNFKIIHLTTITHVTVTTKPRYTSYTANITKNNFTFTYYLHIDRVLPIHKLLILRTLNAIIQLNRTKQHYKCKYKYRNALCIIVYFVILK